MYFRHSRGGGNPELYHYGFQRACPAKRIGYICYANSGMIEKKKYQKLQRLLSLFPQLLPHTHQHSSILILPTTITPTAPVIIILAVFNQTIVVGVE